MDMIFALLDVTSACQVPFGIPQYIRCTHHLFLFTVKSCDPCDGLLVADYYIYNGKIIRISTGTGLILEALSYCSLLVTDGT